MPYDKNDPRSQLSTAGNAPAGIPRPAQYRELHEVGPDEKHDNGSNTWWTRSQAMLIGWTEARPGDELTLPMWRASTACWCSTAPPSK